MQVCKNKGKVWPNILEYSYLDLILLFAAAFRGKHRNYIRRNKRARFLQTTREFRFAPERNDNSDRRKGIPHI